MGFDIAGSGLDVMDAGIGSKWGKGSIGRSGSWLGGIAVRIGSTCGGVSTDTCGAAIAAAALVTATWAGLTGCGAGWTGGVAGRGGKYGAAGRWGTGAGLC